MIERRPFNQLGGADHGWLKAKHHFSFAGYHDPSRMAWGNLRVWNDDEIAAQTGFPPHPHADMEIITYVRDGAITHRDSLGNQGRTVAGDVQVMSAGSGIQHAEYNLEHETTRIFQIWILPTRRGGEPSWGARPFPKGDRSGRFVALASGIAGDGDALPIRTDARVLGATLRAGESVRYELGAGGVITVDRRAWFNPNLESRWQLMPALIAALSMLQTLLIAALSVAREREQGTFDQLLVTPLTPMQILVGKAVPSILVGLLQSTIILLIIRFWFGIPMAGSPWLLYLGLVVFTIAAVGLGLSISALAVNMQQAMLYTFLLIMPLMLLSGLITPVRNMPVALQVAT